MAAIAVATALLFAGPQATLAMSTLRPQKFSGNLMRQITRAGRAEVRPTASLRAQASYPTHPSTGSRRVNRGIGGRLGGLRRFSVRAEAAGVEAKVTECEEAQKVFNSDGGKRTKIIEILGGCELKLRTQKCILHTVFIIHPTEKRRSRIGKANRHKKLPLIASTSVFLYVSLIRLPHSQSPSFPTLTYSTNCLGDCKRLDSYD
eukprot:1387678-Amorphochlora_amoeboformis.AAC.2